MYNTSIVLLLTAIAVAWIWLNPILIKLKRQRLKNKPFPLQWAAIIEETIPFYQYLPEYLQKRLRDRINVFIAEKQFIGCGGLQITDRIKAIVAAQACLLLLSDRGDYYANLASVLVYPSAYLANTKKYLGGDLVEETQEIRLGESWYQDRVILAWEQIEYDTKHWRDGHNVILHEFAHQLDAEDGSVNGVPLLDRKIDYKIWAQVFEREYKKLSRDIELDLPTVIDEYGANNAAEFFAVVTETFFEKPRQLQKQHPELYEQLKGYYQLDPFLWNER
jgi:MtfA peptidase